MAGPVSLIIKLLSLSSQHLCSSRVGTFQTGVLIKWRSAAVVGWRCGECSERMSRLEPMSSETAPIDELLPLSVLDGPDSMLLLLLLRYDFLKAAIGLPPPPPTPPTSCSLPVFVRAADSRQKNKNKKRLSPEIQKMCG